VPLANGARLGPYEILGALGAGGMGEVYRARDTRLGRDVAIKVLPAHLSASPEVRARFEREARTISQLNHPHICTLYDVGHQDDVDYLVMELLEGETLAHRLEKGPLPLAEVLRLGIQIAEALDRAHHSGIVHRDLKPGNVMLTKGGAKLMDFGLARATGLVPLAGAETESATVSRPLTAEGTVVGTFQYMAPEQLEGKEADARADIWALGCVLYEMATGKRAFEGASQASLIAAVLEHEPAAITALRPASPPVLDHVVRGCLAKDPAERWQSARDVIRELEWVLAAGSGAGLPAPVAVRRRWRERLAWGIVVAAVATAVVALVALQRARRPTERRLVRLAVTAPSGGTLVNDVSASAISPDGRLLVFTVMDPAGAMRLWLRPLDSLTAQPLPGTEGATFPFWSPDSRVVAFFAQGKLRKVPAAGGAPAVICDAGEGRGGSWSKDGVIVFAPQAMGPLLRVSADGAGATEVARPHAARGETGLRFPCFLPDGRHFLYVSLLLKQRDYDVYLGALDSKEPRRVMSALSAPVYAEPGYLLFALADRLVAQRFDGSTLQPVGPVVPLADAPPPSNFAAGVALSASANGVLAHSASSPPETELVWLDRAGRQTGRVLLPPGSYSNPSLSPDGRFATVARFNSYASYDLWLVDLQRAVTTRLTFDGLVSGGNFGSDPVVWSPDSTRVAYRRWQSGRTDVYQMLASGAGQPEPLVQSDVVFKGPVAWSPDGKYLVFSQQSEGGQYDLWLLPLHGDRTPVPYLRTPFTEDLAALSPDGRWVAYDSDETGRPEIYVRSFPEPGEKYRVSTSGGMIAQWSRDGKKLAFFSLGPYYYGSGPIYVVDVETKPTFKAGTPRVLFTPRPDLSGPVATADLSRFLATAPTEGATPASITITLNWQAVLER
jgi:eukaryotic-like serine/threonine-protein kinase